jgi:hypothetical protein
MVLLKVNQSIDWFNSAAWRVAVMVVQCSKKGRVSPRQIVSGPLSGIGS